MRIIHVLAIFISMAASAKAGNENYTLGARQAGLGGCGLTLRDVWGTQHNQANLAFIDNYTFGAYYENKFLLKETALKSFAGAVPLGNAGTFGLVGTQFGSVNYNQLKIGLGYGMKIAENFSAGVQLNYNSLRLGDIYGSKNSFTAEFGINARLIEKLTFGAHIYNVSRTLLTKENNEFIPTTIRLGLEYKFSEAVFALIETESTINQNTNMKFGVEYNLKRQFYLRAGINTNPFLASFGFGYNYKMVYIDIAAAYHQVLGFTPALSFHLKLGGEKKKELSEPAN